jgi:carboxylesterase type B
MALLPPEPPHHWEDPLDCCNFGSAVPQSDPSASTLTLFGIPSNTELNYGSIGDDCLNLNVSTPVLHSEEDDAVLLQNPTLPSPASRPSALPVIVWIHGGANKQGSNAEGGFLVDSVAFGEEKVVTVSVNYRLGLLGFGHLTSSEHNNESQNLALKDLHLALEWVQTNISTFGGNPNNVTLLGESAGAVNIAGLLASPYAPNRLFHRAVLSSGGPNDLPIDVYDQHVKPGLFTMNVDGNNVKSEVDGVLSQSLGGTLCSFLGVCRRVVVVVVLPDLFFCVPPTLPLQNPRPCSLKAWSTVKLVVLG